MGQVRDAGLDLAGAQLRQLGDLGPALQDRERIAVDLQLAVDLIQRRPGRSAVGVAHGRHIVELDPAHAGAHAELAAAGPAEGEIRQVTADLELRRARLAAPDRIAHIVARLGVHAQRQVAVHAGAVGARQRGIELEPAGKAAARRAADRAAGRIAGLPAALGLAGGIGIGKAQLRDFDLDAVAVDRPLQFGLQPIELQPGLFEKARKIERAAFELEAGLAAAVAGIEVQAGAAQSRPAVAGVAGLQAQPADLSLGLPSALGLRAGLPLQLELLDQTGWLQLAQPMAPRGRQGQLCCQLAQRQQVEPVALQSQRLQTTPFFTGLAGLAVAQVAAGPGGALVGAESQVAGRDLECACLLLQLEAPVELLQLERLEIGRQPQRKPAQRQVAREAGPLATAQLAPEGQRAFAILQFQLLQQAGVEVLAQRLQPEFAEFAIELAAPVLQLARAGQRQQRLAKAPAQAEARAPVRRWRGVQPQLVLAARVAQQQADLAQLQRRRLRAQFVAPAQQPVAQQEFTLGKEPVGRLARAAAARQRDAGQRDHAVGLAAQLELRPIDHQLLEAQAQQRAQRQRAEHAGQAQRLAPLRVEQAQLAQRQPGQQAS